MRKLFALATLIIGVGFVLGGGFTWENVDGNRFWLAEPSLVTLTAEAQEQGDEGNFLQQEAGIAAYVKVDQEIDIAQLRGSFKVVEQLKDTYVTGQIPVPDLEENWHPRVFVTRDGWIVAYYPKDEPTSKMLALWIQHDNRALEGTTLEFAIREVLRNAPEVPVSAIEGIKYYHFQHPTADRLMLIREDTDGEDTFQLSIPSGLQVLDATWIARSTVTDCCSWAGLRIDDEDLVGGQGAWGIRFGGLLRNLKTDTQQTVKAWRGNYSIMLLYKAP